MIRSIIFYPCTSTCSGFSSILLHSLPARFQGHSVNLPLKQPRHQRKRQKPIYKIKAWVFQIILKSNRPLLTPSVGRFVIYQCFGIFSSILLEPTSSMLVINSKEDRLTSILVFWKRLTLCSCMFWLIWRWTNASHDRRLNTHPHATDLSLNVCPACVCMCVRVWAGVWVIPPTP